MDDENVSCAHDSEECAQKSLLRLPVELEQVDSAHDELITDLTAIDNTIYSCSFDPSIKSWMLTNTGLVHQRTYDMSELQCPNCILSCPERAIFATGSYYGTVDVFDSRSSNKPIYQYRPHTEYVTRLAMNTEYILSASLVDGTIPGRFPTCMSMRRDLVCVGDYNAKLHMLDPKNDFELVKSYSTEHTALITGMRLTHGSLITSSRDGTVRISSPTDPPKLIAILRSEMNREISSMDYLNDTLAVSASIPGIEVWRPKN
ncbi:F-box/WD repeat-containing protein 9-like [Temnothorax longispinosus]|uniref:F-box/WD repeat-containing protein 9-like n=1 Tax=Temnothorax longispinosus TaxID=300112 RepID=UPI003A99DAB0